MTAWVDEEMKHAHPSTRRRRQPSRKRGANQTIEHARDVLAGREIDLDTILRWEDDGGKIIEDNGSEVDLNSFPLVQME